MISFLSLPNKLLIFFPISFPILPKLLFTLPLLIFFILEIKMSGESKVDFSHHNRGVQIEQIEENSTAIAGSDAYLPCSVRFLGDKTVSWIRRRDLHILSSGPLVFTSDSRFSLLLKFKENNVSSWTLKIQKVGKKDEGFYECQVNTEPKQTVTLHLTLLDGDSKGVKMKSDEVGSESSSSSAFPPLPQLDYRSSFFGHKPKGEAQLLGPSSLNVKSGGILKLNCVISGELFYPNLTWYLNSVPILQNRKKGGTSIETTKSEHFTISTLTLGKIGVGDEGSYSCGDNLGHVQNSNHVQIKITENSDDIREANGEISDSNLKNAQKSEKNTGINKNPDSSMFLLSIFLLLKHLFIANN